MLSTTLSAFVAATGLCFGFADVYGEEANTLAEGQTVQRAVGLRLRADQVFSGRGLVELPTSDAPMSPEILNDEERASLLRPTLLALLADSEPMRTTQENVFNLWTVNETYPGSDRNVAVISWDLIRETSEPLVLGIGSDDGIAVVQDEQVIYARRAFRDFSDSSALVPVALHPGVNRFRLISERIYPRSTNYYAPEWIVRIRTFSDRTSAIQKHFINNRHILAHPIVHSLSELRVTLPAPFIHKVSAWALDGTRISEGEVDHQGNISWNKSELVAPTIVRIENDHRRSEFALVTGDDPTRAVAAKMAASARAEEPLARAWQKRIEILNRDENFDPSSIQWAQKLVQSITGLCSPEETLATAGNGVHSIELRTFTSTIDGSSQYFLCYVPEQLRSRNKNAVEADADVLFILPCPTAPLRPFLEGRLMAGIQELECWAATADDHNIILVWPGYAEIDFGGPVAQREIAETVEAFSRAYGSVSRNLYIMGVCASGVAATRLGDSIRPHVAGLALYSPVLSRFSRRWLPGVETFSPIVLPKPDWSGFSPFETVKAYPGSKWVTIFDSGMPGHGNAKDTAALLAACRAENAKAKDIQVGTSTEYAWGERMKYRLSLFLEALIDGNASSAGTRTDWASLANLQHPLHAPTTITEALLNGYHVEAGDAALEQWATAWSEVYTRWRGCEVPRPPSSRRTSIALLSLDASSPLAEKVSLEVSRKYKMQQGEKLFGALLVAHHDKPTVVIFHSGQAMESLPAYDPLLDGGEQGVVFKMEKGRWQQVALW